MRIGRHIPTGSQPGQALQRAKAIGCEAVQVFVTNPRGWAVPATDPRRETVFRAATEELGLGPVVVHATYLINLASPRDDFFARSTDLLRATLERAGRHGASDVVVHIGSHMGSGVETGLGRLAEGVRRVLDDAQPGPRLLLENDVGAGGEIGNRFEHLADVLAAAPDHRARLGVCIDTAHLWGAGFDIGTREGAENVLMDIDRVIGLDRVRVVHLNDTSVALGSHRDIHARVGEGIIGQEGLATLLRAPGLAHTAVILETPIREETPGKSDWAHETAHLRRVLALAGRPVATDAPDEPNPAGDADTDAPRARTRAPRTKVGVSR
ncbi:MAG TPA: deoxyribonuclease IV [Ktedonobacterales bacterium]